MKVALFRSIRTRIMAATILLIMAIVSTVVWSWAKNESEIYRSSEEEEAQTLAAALSSAWTNALVDQNWGQIRLNINLLLKRNPEFVYILVSDTRLSNQIVAALPDDFQEQYVPDVVPTEVTNKALEVYGDTHVKETFLLRRVSKR
jgi:adenylate cyclase